MDADIGVEEDDVLASGVCCASVPSAGWSARAVELEIAKAIGPHQGFHGLRRAVINH
jgi:hypothetical protein